MKTPYSFLVLLFGILLATIVHAGPPLICHPYEIGAAKSLPAGETKGTDPNYDRSRLVTDTLAFLTPEAPILVRMETLRRAAIYATDNLRAWRTNGAYTPEDRKLAHGLLERLRARTQQGGDAERTLALFDLGFFAETLRQTKLDPALDGYALLLKVAEQLPNDAEVQFAIAVASEVPGRKDVQPVHLQQAKAGAKPASLLSKNLQSHF